MDVERHDVGEAGPVRVSEREALELTAGLDDQTLRAIQLEEPAEVGRRIGDPRLEADPVELPQPVKVRRTGASNHATSLDCDMPAGRVESIHVAASAGEAMRSVAEVRAIPGRGLESDRYFSKTGTYSGKEGADRQITFIEAEALEALQRDYRVALEPKESRRNVATRGVALNHLVGRRFWVGEVALRGLRLCEPCAYMERVSGKPVRAGLVHRGGLRAEILTEGTIRVGDEIQGSEEPGNP